MTTETITFRTNQTLDNWRKRLAGEAVLTHEADPDIGFYRQRHKDIKNGMTVPPELRLKNVIDIATKPAWAWSILRGLWRTPERVRRARREASSSCPVRRPKTAPMAMPT